MKITPAWNPLRSCAAEFGGMPRLALDEQRRDEEGRFASGGGSETGGAASGQSYSDKWASKSPDHALVAKMLDRQGSYTSDITRGPDLKAAREMAKNDPALELVMLPSTYEGGQPIRGPGGRLKGWGGVAKVGGGWVIRKRST